MQVYPGHNINKTPPYTLLEFGFNFTLLESPDRTKNKAFNKPVTNLSSYMASVMTVPSEQPTSWHIAASSYSPQHNTMLHR